MTDENRKPRRLLRWLLIALISLAGIYLIAANLVLNTNLLLGLINKRPEKSLIEWTSGRTLLPGRIHIEGLRIRGQSKGQQWEIRIALNFDGTDVDYAIGNPALASLVSGECGCGISASWVDCWRSGERWHRLGGAAVVA